MSNLFSTDIDRDFKDIPIDPDFHRQFWRGLFISIAIGFVASIGLLTAVVNAEEIDAWFEKVLRMIFI